METGSVSCMVFLALASIACLMRRLAAQGQCIA
jgi:hypothetical protein